MAFSPTPAQKLAIETRGKAILVSAAAGSGKTRVLTERLAHWVTDPEQPQDIDRFLVITYTRAAAAELRGRILRSLGELAAAHPGDPRLRRQSTLCCRAHIETIHSFCAGLLRENCHALGLAPDFQVAEETRIAAIRERVLDTCLEDVYLQLEQQPALQALVDTVGAGRDDKRLRRLLLQLHTQMQSHPDPQAWAEAQKAALYAEDAVDAGQTVWGRELLENAARLTGHWAAAMDHALEWLRTGGVTAYLDSYTQTADAIHALHQLAQQRRWDDLVQALPVPFPRTKSIRGEKPPEALFAAEIRDACKKAMEKLHKQFSDRSVTLLEELRGTAPAMEALLSLVQVLDDRFCREKRRLNLVDFSDLEHLALQLLWDGKKQCPTLAAEALSRRFTEILVDEYQDVNAVQDLLFRCLSRQGENLFMVGDVKQSIYRFRLADPGIFLDKYTRAGVVGDPNAALWRIDLQQNFRSRGCVLNGCNFVFRTLMSPRLGELEYDAAAALRLGAKYPDPEAETPVSLRVLPPPENTDSDQRPDNTAREAAYVAGEIEALVRSGMCITVDGETRPVEYGDIAILLRSANSVGPCYRRALAERGIPVAATQGEGFFTSLEISVLLSLLAVIDNPHQDVPLIGVLRSPFLGFTPDMLAAIRAENRDCDFYTALCLHEAAEPRCGQFLDFLRDVRALAPDLEPEILLETIYRRLDFPAMCAVLPDGAARQENLHTLLGLAVQFSGSGLRGLHAFVAWLRRRMERGDVPATGGGQGVQIMSIHRSKGLEFPVVFLADTARRFNLSDLQAAVLMHPQLGLGPKCTDPVLRLEYPTLARRAIAARLRRETLSEELRVLYVAMTRARERLIITACAKLPERHSTCPPDAEELLADSSMVAWLLRCCALPDSPLDFSIAADSGSFAEMLDKRPESLPEAEAVKATPSTAPLDWSYPHAAAVTLPSKLTATELKAAGEVDTGTDGGALLLSPGRRSFRKPDLRGQHRTLSPTERGTAAHLALQYLDFTQIGSPAAIADELARLQSMGLLTPQQAAAVCPETLLRFFTSPLGKRIRSAEQLWREIRFSLLCDAGRWYPEAAGEEVLLQGVVDCCILEQGKLTVIDYKTDRVMDETWRERAGHYGIQLETYAFAMERLLGLPVRECILHFLQGNISVRLCPQGEIEKL